MIEKQSSKCNVVKSINEFYDDGRTNDGKQYQCRKCSNEQNLRWKENNSEIVKKVWSTISK